MNLFDPERGFLKPQNIQKEWKQYEFYSNGDIVEFNSYQELVRQLQKDSKKIFVIKVKYPNFRKNQDQQANIDHLIRLLKKQNKFSSQQLDLIHDKPQIVFQKQLFEYRYILGDPNETIPKQRQEDLINMFLTGSTEWKEATLDEMQHISKNYLNLIRKSANN